MKDFELFCEFTRCMAAYLRGETYAPSLSAEDWGKLYALAKRQSLSGALHAVTDGCAMPDAVHDRLRRDAFLTLARYETQQQIQKELCDILSEAGATHLLFKGAVVRRYYRHPAMRSMGDIDAAVPLICRELANTALLANGFEKTEEQPEVWVYQKHGVLIELHTVLRSYNALTQDKEPYKELWADARQKQGLTHHLSDEAEIAFAVAHMASHFCGGGCGIRQLMDIAVLYERFPDPALWDGVLARLEVSALDRFARHMLWLCHAWFGIEISDTLTSALESDTEEWLLTRMLSNGTFGTDERRMLSRMRQDRRLQKHGGKTGTLTRWLFPTPTYLKRRYAYAENPLLLPAAYVHRLFDGVTKNRRLHTARLQYAKNNADVLEQEVRLFEEIGL